MDATLNYGMYFTIKDVFQRGGSMKMIADRWSSNAKHFKDIDALGLFVDNHDNPRFLNGNSDWRVFKSALAFALTARGIPIFYYGSEQGFGGGYDPANREPMWNNFNQNHEIFKFIQAINRARKATSANTMPFQEKWVDDNFYCFTRGKFFVGLTNRVSGSLSVDVPNTGFSEGDTVCNIFNSSDCVRIGGGKLHLTLNNGEVKIYIPKGNSFFQNKSS